MYNKNLTEDLRLRLSQNDMDFLRETADKRGTSVSEVIRSIIGEYHRSLEALELLKKSMELVNVKGEAVHGNTETDINHLI